MTLTVVASDNAGDQLQLVGEASAAWRDFSTGLVGGAPGINYSFDTIEPVLVGFAIEHAISTSSEMASPTSEVLVGEELTYDVDLRWFGLIDGEDVTAIDVTHTIPAATIAASATAGGTTDLVSNPKTVTFAPTDLAPTAIVTDATFSAQMTLQNDANDGTLVDSSTYDNIVAATFAYRGRTIDSNTTGYPSTSSRTASATVTEPNLTISKGHSQNLAGPFSTTLSINANDLVYTEYVVENTGTATAYDLVLTDVIPSQLDYVTTESASLGSIGHTTGTITWTIGDLAAGATATAVIRTLGNGSANPDDNPSSSASSVSYSLDSGSSATNASTRRRTYNDSSAAAAYLFPASGFPRFTPLASNDASPLLRGTAAPGLDLDITIDGQTERLSNVPGDGNWTLSWPHALSDDTYSVSVTNVSGGNTGVFTDALIIDTDGNVTASVDFATFAYGLSSNNATPTLAGGAPPPTPPSPC